MVDVGVELSDGVVVRVVVGDDVGDVVAVLIDVSDVVPVVDVGDVVGVLRWQSPNVPSK